MVVVETDTGENSTLTQQLTYDFTNTPTVTSVTPNVLSVLGKKLVFFLLINLKIKSNRKKGGQALTISGTNLPTTFSSSIMIGGKAAQLVSTPTSTQIVISSPALTSGTYSLNIPCGSTIGYAR